MAKVHIALVGGQPTPVYQGVILSSPDRIILICSSQTKNKAEEIQEQLKSLQYYNVQIEVFSIEDCESIRFKLEILFGTLSDNDTLSMNLSSGVKIWSLLCLQLCPKDDAHVYCLSQNGKVLTIRGKQDVPYVQFDMFTQFALLGHLLEHYTKFSEYTEIEQHDYEVISRLYTNNTFQKLLKKLQVEAKSNKTFFKEDQSVTIDDNDYHYIEWSKEDGVFAISLGESINFYHEVSGAHAITMLVNTGWFEYEVASYFARLYGGDNVFTNCIFKSENGQDKNEIDIIANTGQKLIFVECKTEIKEITAIDKFASVVKNYGGDGSKAMFITRYEMNKIQQEKCRDNHIADFYVMYNIKNQEGKVFAQSITDEQLRHKLNEFITIANE